MPPVIQPGSCVPITQDLCSGLPDVQVSGQFPAGTVPIQTVDLIGTPADWPSYYSGGGLFFYAALGAPFVLRMTNTSNCDVTPVLEIDGASIQSLVPPSGMVSTAAAFTLTLNAPAPAPTPANSLRSGSDWYEAPPTPATNDGLGRYKHQSGAGSGNNRLTFPATTMAPGDFVEAAVQTLVYISGFTGLGGNALFGAGGGFGLTWRGYRV